ncbi:hypothetical protein D3C80_2117980 [compost metagenome]
MTCNKVGELGFVFGQGLFRETAAHPLQAMGCYAQAMQGVHAFLRVRAVCTQALIGPQR